MYGLVTTVPPAAEPLTLADAKTHLRVDWDAENDLIWRWVKAARRLTEDHTGRRWLTQTVRLTLDDWAACDDDWWPGVGQVIRLPVRPVQSVATIKYYDIGGVRQTMAVGLYQTWLDHDPPLVAPAPLTVWPTPQSGRLGGVEIVFVAGESSLTAVPEQVRAAILLTLGYWYGNRGDGDDPAKLGLPAGALRILDSLDQSGYR